MKISMIKQLITLFSLFFLSACHSDSVTSAYPTFVPPAPEKATQNPQFKQLKQRFSQLKRGDKTVIRITQFGDSHTAADFFTGQLRKALQNQYGDAGIGWLSPIAVHGQRHNAITYQSNGWQLYDSRKTAKNDYPMGGYIAKAQSAAAKIILSDRKPSSGKWLLRLLSKTNKLSEQWQLSNHTVNLPVTLFAVSENMKIGGIWLTRIPAQGVIVESVAANGAQNTLWDNWNHTWPSRDLAQFSRSDMVILAYGTNEAFNNTLNIQRFQSDILRRIRTIKQVLPHSVILIIGTPESYQHRQAGLASPTLATQPGSISSNSTQVTKRQNSFSEANYPTTLAGVAAMKAKQRKAEIKAAPTSISKEQTDSCDRQRPPQLSRIQQVLADIARQQQVLYWDWQAAMGGKCQVNRLIEQGLMQKDGIHFTRSGYQHSANQLLSYLRRIGLI